MTTISSLTTNDLVSAQLNTGLSNLGIKKLVSAVNQRHVRKLVEPNFNSNFKTAGEQLKDFFTHTLTKASNAKEGPATDHLIVHCKNLLDLHNKVLLSRATSSDYIAKLGIDGGRGFLKFYLSVVDKNPRGNRALESPPQKRLLTQRIVKDTSVKRQMLVAVSEDLPETYSNVEQIWSLIKDNAINFFAICDLKLANIICGLQTHSSSHPCC